jgi:spermidine dehydrogenase
VEERRALDAITYAEHLERGLGYGSEVTRYIAPVIGLISGASPDVVSAWAVSQIGMPGTGRARGRTGSLPRSFPGGNSTIARHFVKYLAPDAISGEKTLDGVYDGRVDFGALDLTGSPVRIRTGATVLRVEHEGSGDNGSGTVVAWEREGRVYRARASAVILASGGWINRHICADMPAETRAAYAEFTYAPAMVVNVALNNWRFMHRMGIAAARWFDEGFGFSCNIRRPMRVGGQTVPLHPDRPAVLTFYMGIRQPGPTAREQGARGREMLLSTPFAEWERRLRSHMNRLFADSGFDAARDIAGIILNRWGHARMVQPPGFYFGTGGRPSPREVVETGWGRIVIGHSEMNGHQSMTGAMSRGSQAVEKAMALI